MQTYFAAYWCFWFSANGSSIEHICPPLVYAISLSNQDKNLKWCQQLLWARVYSENGLV